MPVSTWNYSAKGSASAHGANGTGFSRRIRLGEDDRHIATVDEGGVALAAIQGLSEGS